MKDDTQLFYKGKKLKITRRQVYMLLAIVTVVVGGTGGTFSVTEYFGIKNDQSMFDQHLDTLRGDQSNVVSRIQRLELLAQVLDQSLEHTNHVFGDWSAPYKQSVEFLVPQERQKRVCLMRGCNEAEYRVLGPPGAPQNLKGEIIE